MRLRWFLGLSFLSSFAGAAETQKGHLLTACAAQTDVISTAVGGCSFGAPLDAGTANGGSFQVNWSGLTTGSSISGAAVVEVSNDNVLWATKSGAILPVSTANGNDFISLTGGVITEKYYRVHWEGSGTITGGTVDVYALLKGSPR